MNRKIKNVIIFTGLVTVTIHVLNRIQYSLSTVKNILNNQDNQYFEWRFGKVRYTKKGTGSPILCLHDLSVGSSSYEFHEIVNELSKKHEVYLLDYLGFGLSDKPNMTYTNYLYVQLLNEFIKTIIGRKTDIISSGESAAISILASHNDPDIINNILLINPPSIPSINRIPSKHSKVFKFLIDSPILGTFIFNCLTTKSSFERQFKERMFYNHSLIQTADITAYLEASHTYDANSKFSYSSYLGKYMNANIIHALKEINHSIYIFAGKEEKNITSIIDNYTQLNPSIESFFIENSKHLPHLENPEKLLNKIKFIF